MNYFQETSEKCDEITEKASKYLDSLPFIPNLHFPREYPNQEYIAKCEERWNSENWQKKNKTNGFLKSITPRSIYRG